MKRWLGPTAALALAAAGCNDDGVNGAFTDPPVSMEAGYPAGPYSVHPGSVIDNYKFKGFPNSLVNNAVLGDIALADFYNPHADDPTYVPDSPDTDDRLYPKGSPYGAGEPKPKAIAISVGAVWCAPCNTEAKTELPPRHAKYKPLGGEFLMQLIDGASQGTAATQKDLVAWMKKYKVDYPGTIDPSHSFGALFDPNSFPENLVIDTRTMKIVEVVAGVPDEAYWEKFEQTIAGK